MRNIEPSADMRKMAYDFAQLFTALTSQGFTEAQALVIIGQVIAAAMRSAPGDDDGNS